MIWMENQGYVLPAQEKATIITAKVAASRKEPR